MKKDFEFKCRTAYEYKNLSLQEYYKTRNINRRIVRLKQNVLSTGCTRNTVTKFKKKKNLCTINLSFFFFLFFSF